MSKFFGKLEHALPTPYVARIGEKVTIQARMRTPMPNDGPQMLQWHNNRRSLGFGTVTREIMITETNWDLVIQHEDGEEAIYCHDELAPQEKPIDPQVVALDEFLNKTTLFEFGEVQETADAFEKLLLQGLNIRTVARMLAEYEHTRRRCKQLTAIYPLLERVLLFQDPLEKLKRAGQK